MKYKLSKKAPTPGEVKNAEIEEVSWVFEGANGRKMLLKKGMDNMDEELRKKLLAEGINPENLAKSSKADLVKIGTAIDAVTAVTDEPVKKGLLATVKGLLGINEPVTKSESGSNELSDRLEKIEKALESLAKSQTTPESENDTPPATSELEELKKKSSDIAKAIEEENNKDSEIEELRKKVSEQEKQLEQIKKRRTGGNAHTETPAKTEPVNKSVFAGSPFDIG